MSEPRRCPQCDAEIPVNSPAGLCPRCLLAAANDSQSAAAEPGPTQLTPPASGFVPPTIEELAPLFPQLEILELLGKGGMGAVYKARQPGLDRLVALKILPPEIRRDPAFTERFQREARALARLSHPHIVSVYDFGVVGQAFQPDALVATGQAGKPDLRDGLCYIVMEFVDGANLRQAIKAGKLTAAEALAIVPQICEALQFAHDEGIVHRDIKPENILIDKRGRVKIADFGLAKLLGQDASDHSLTATHQVMGTLRYMAPEQMQGSREVDHRADIYSLGVVFYELLTGELPMGRFAPPSKKVQVDVRLDEIVLRALEQDPEQRYQHASDVKTDVDTISRSPNVARPESAKVVVSPAHVAPTPFDDSGRATPPRLVQGPADCLLLAAGIAFVTACGVALWLGVTPSLGRDMTNLTNPMIRGNLTGMSIGLAIYSVFVALAGLLLRRLRRRLVVLLVAVIVGLFFPAVVALNVVMEFRNIPVWPVVIPLWLGMPAALWVVVTLFRDDVRCAFDAAGVARRESAERDVLPRHASIAEPRFSRFAIAGAVWALFGLLAVIPTLYFIGLNRVWNGTALPTDVIHTEPPLVFSIFMGALLVIGAGAPIGTTIYGGIAIGHIKRSGGKIIGLPLAVADVLFFPLLVLSGLIAALVAQVVFAMAPHPNAAAVTSAGAVGLLVALVVCFFVARAVWRAIARQDKPIDQSPPTSSETMPRRRRLLIAIAALLAIAIPVAVWLKPLAWTHKGVTSFRLAKSLAYVHQFGDHVGLAVWIEEGEPDGADYSEHLPGYDGAFRLSGNRRLSYRCATGDGQHGTVSFNLNGNGLLSETYQLAAGRLFLVSTQREKVTIRQLNPDLSGISPKKDGLTEGTAKVKALAESDDAVRRFLAGDIANVE